MNLFKFIAILVVTVGSVGCASSVKIRPVGQGLFRASVQNWQNPVAAMDAVTREGIAFCARRGMDFETDYRNIPYRDNYFGEGRDQHSVIFHCSLLDRDTANYYLEEGYYY